MWSSPCLFADLCENKSYNRVIHILFAIYQYIYIYIVGGKRQVNYKFIPTDLFRGCPLIIPWWGDDEWATTKQVCRDELVVYLSFSSHNIYNALLLCIEHCVTKVKILHFIYIYQPRHGTMKGTNIIYFGSKCFAGLGFLTYEWIKKKTVYCHLATSSQPQQKTHAQQGLMGNSTS